MSGTSRFPMRPGSQVDWTAVADRYENLVWSVAAKFGLSSHDAEEMFQNTWMIAFSRGEAPEDEGMVPWLLGIACRVAKGVRRTKRPWSLEDEEAARIEDQDEPLPESVLASAEAEQAVREAFARLAPRDRALLEALYLSDTPRPYAEIAACLGIAVGSITTLKLRALRRLRDAI